MSIYRQVGRGRPAVLAALALVSLAVGIAVGVLIAGDDDQPSLAAAVDDLRERMQPAVQGLDVLPVEYAQGGGEVRGAVAQLERSTKAYEESRQDLTLLAPVESAQLGRQLLALRDLIDRHAPPATVRAAAERTEATARRALRLPTG
jgi:hypothetical protein